MERFVLLPFSVGCISESSVAVAAATSHHQGKPPKPAHYSRSIMPRLQEVVKEEEEEEDEQDDEDLRSPPSLVSLPRLQKLLKNFKSFSQLFVEKDETDEEEMGMEIGFPTDVKHVTHIGVDGSAASILSRGWEDHHHNDFKDPSHLTMPSFHLRPFEKFPGASRNSSNLCGTS